MKKRLVLCLTLAAILTLTACLERGSSVSTENTNQPTIPTHTHTGGATRQLEGELTILAPAHFVRVLNAAATEMAQSRKFTIHVTSFNPDTHAEYWAQHVSNFDMFFIDPYQPLLQLAQSGALADFFQLIDNCVLFPITHFYDQALHALSINDTLPFFPLGFGMQYVGISTTVFPQHIVDEFLQKERITTLQMMELFADESRNNFNYIYQSVLGEMVRTRTNDTQFATCRDMLYPGFLTWNMLPNFIDINDRTANLTHPSFVRFLELLGTQFDTGITSDMTTSGNFRHNTRGAVENRYHSDSESWTIEIGARTPFGFIANGLDMNNSSTRYGFAIHNEFLTPFNTITQIYPCYLPNGFVGFIPLVDERGSVITNMASQFPWKTIAVANNHNAQLAWEFISQYLIPATICPTATRREATIPSAGVVRPNIGTHSLDMPVTRSLTEEHVRQMFYFSQYILWIRVTGADGNRSVSPSTGIPIVGFFEAGAECREQTIAAAIAHIEDLNDLPLAPIPLVPPSVFEHIVFNMLRGMVSPQEAAQQIDRAVNEWLRM